MNTLDPRKTALVLIDLQQGVLGFARGPYAGAAVVAKGAALAGRFRALSAPVVLVAAGWSADFADAPRQPVDAPMPRGDLPADWLTLAPELDASPGDIRIVKRQWGAFYGTELDLQLRRRGIDTIVLGGIATNFGVESTARTAWELGYRLILPEDAMSSTSAEAHRFAVETVFPRIGLVRTTEQVLAALG